MTKYTMLALFGAIFVVGALIGTVGFSATAFTVAPATMVQSDATGLMGHITLTVTDADGEITQYRQTDNTIINAGEDCISVAMFNIATGTENCVDATGAAFEFIALGTGGNAGASGTCGSQPAESDGTLFTEVTEGTNAGLDKTQATTRSNAAASGATGAVATLSADFTSSSGTVAINEALLSNLVTSTSGDTVAHQCFAPVNVGTADTLTVEWQITTG